MGLVDDDQRDARLPQCAQESMVAEAFRSGVDELVRTRGNLIHGAPLFGGSERAVDQDGPCAEGGRQTFNLIFIRAISGESTSAVPGRSSAESWKVSDFPAPVGRIASVFTPASTRLMTAA